MSDDAFDIDGLIKSTATEDDIYDNTNDCIERNMRINGYLESGIS